MGGEHRHNYAHSYFTKLSFFFANDAYGKKKIRDTSEIEREIYFFSIIYIFTRFTEGHGKHSINRTSGFNGDAVLSPAVRCNKVESSCKVYACWKLHENFVSIFCLLIRNASNFIIPGAVCLARLCLKQIPPPPPPPPFKKSLG